MEYGIRIRSTIFFLNADTLNECVSKLSALCMNNPNILNCKYFLDHVAANRKNINRDIEQIKTLSRNKRFRRYFLSGLVRRIFYGVGFAAIFIEMGVSQFLIRSQAQKSREMGEQIRKQLSISKTTQDLYAHLFNESSIEIDKLHTEISKLNTRVLSEMHVNDVLHIATLSLMQHYRDCNRFLDILSENIRPNIFKIIDTQV